MSRPARRVLGYARVSSEEQARGSSLRDQQASIAAHAQSLGLTVAKFYVEAVSGIREKTESRAQMQALLRDVKRGDLVLCDKLDRWSRDAEFSYRSVRQILEAGAHFFAVAEALDPSTSEGDTALSFRILFAREEHKRIKARMVGTRKILRDQGYYVEGLPPYGYRRPHAPGYKGSDKNVLTVEPDEADVVRSMYRMCIAGRSMQKIADALYLKRDRVKDALRSRVYLGEIQSSAGEWIAGKHPAIIDAATFVRAQDALDGRRLGGPRPRSAPSQTDDWILRDVAVCGLCGARMGASYGRTQYYYRCAHGCTSRYVPVRLVEMAAEPLVVARLTALREELGREPRRPTLRLVAPGPGARRAKLEAKRARYLETYAEGLLGRDAMLAGVGKVDAELLRLAAEAPTAEPLADPAIRRETLRQVATIEQAWRQADPKVRRAIVGHLAVSVGLVADDPPVPKWRSAEELAGSW